MKSTSKNKIYEVIVNSFNEEIPLEPTNKPEEFNHQKYIECLKDCYPIKGLEIITAKLTSNFINLIDQEPFDGK